MRHLILTCGAMLLTALCGCRYPECVSARWEENVNTTYPVYRFPVKFYVESITPEKPEANIPGGGCYLNPAEAEKLRAGLLKYWPELFSASPENSLRVQIKLTPPISKKLTASLTQSLTGLLSFLGSLGVFPAVENYTAELAVGLSVEDLSQNSNLPMRFRSWSNLGMLGMLLPTCHLMPELPDTALAGKAGGMAGPLLLNVRNEQLREVLLPIVAELHRLPPDKIQELYLSRKTTKINLLE